MTATLPKPSTLEIVTAPDPRLREIARAVAPDEMKYARELGERMRVLVRQHDGVGLAAPQLGVGLRVIVVYADRRFAVCVNPEITHRSVFTAVDTEGCLSHPGRRVRVTRFTDVRVKFLTGYGNPGAIYARGLASRIFQHEIDHLDGINIVDKPEVP